MLSHVAYVFAVVNDRVGYQQPAIHNYRVEHVASNVIMVLVHLKSCTYLLNWHKQQQ